MRFQLLPSIAVLVALLCPACGGTSSPAPTPLLVNSLEDLADPPAGTVTLRSALAATEPGQVIRFDAALDGGTIALTLVDAEHSVLKGEVMGIRDEPSGPVSYLVGYFERDYGRSALYARKDVVIDASDLPSGITLTWAGAVGDDARVLAVYGDLVLRGVTITGGRSVTEDISTADPEQQPWTLARGGGVAVWGRAQLAGCTLYDNHCEGDFESSRDRGAFGGGLYANIVEMEDCVVCGNTVLGGGAGGGGVCSVGGADESPEDVSTIKRSILAGNRIRALFCYGAGVYSDGGGIGNRKTLDLENCTIARNLAEPAPSLLPFLLGMGYWRGGGVYMSNGYLRMHGCTVVENDVFGVPRTDSLDRPNLAGGIAATIGNAHAVEEMILGHSIVTGNLVHELGAGGVVAATYPQDVFTGSLLYFRSLGFNRFGALGFSHILVPVDKRLWQSLCRKHYPKQGDADGVAASEVLDLVGGVTFSDWMLSAGVSAGTPVPLRYAPAGSALDQVPTTTYVVNETFGEYDVAPGATDDFLQILLGRIEAHYGLPGFAAGFTAAFEAYLLTVDVDEDTPGPQPYTDPASNPVLTVADTHFYGPAETWPKEVVNYPWIEFWHHLDAALLAEAIPGMGVELLGDDAWNDLYTAGPLAENPQIDLILSTQPRSSVRLLPVDQDGTARPANAAGDIGAVEIP